MMMTCLFENREILRCAQNDVKNNAQNDNGQCVKNDNIKAIYCDTRQKDKKHSNIEEGFKAMGIEPIRTKLYVGDYSLPLDQSRVIDTKQDLQEVAGNLCQQHKRFAEECDKAAALGIELIILIEENGIKSIEDVPKWYNWRIKKSPKAVDGKKLYSIMKTFEEHHGCRFEFCSKGCTAQRIVELLAGRGMEERQSDRKGKRDSSPAAQNDMRNATSNGAKGKERG